MYRSIFVALSIIASQQAIALELGKLNPIKDRNEFNRIYKGTGPSVIVLNSETCSACDLHEKALLRVIETYKTVPFYNLDISQDAYKDLRQELKIQGYPTTYFISKKEKRSELGNMTEEEIDRVVYEMVNGKPKPLPTKAPMQEEKKAPEPEVKK